MCFSAEASFVASGVLIATGAYTIKKTIDTKDLSFMALALMPLLFGIQQCTEGFIWIFLGKNPNLDYLLTYIFLFFAFLLWPVWVPLSLGIFDHPRKKLFYGIAFLGLIYGCLLYGSPMFYETSFHLELCKRSICYQIRHPLFNDWGVAFYFIFTILPFFFAKSNLIKILGALIGVSAIVSGIFYQRAFTSVWCFFAAVVSVYVGFLAYKLSSIQKNRN